MKTETKKKILFFIRKLLKYDPTKDVSPWIEIETRKVHLIRSQQMYRKQEITMLSEDQIKYHAQLQLMSEMDKQGMIDYGFRDCDPANSEYCVYEAALKVIYP